LSSPALARSLVAEAIGTFALVFAGCGAIMVDGTTAAPGHIGIAITFGLVIMAMICCWRRRSCAARSETSPNTFVRGEPSPSTPG
jgi:glycerol uptake facilitator-like aquaporin